VVRPASAAALAALGLALTVSPALAHITVSPSQSPAGTEERYTLRVPTEKAVPTVGLHLDFPDEVVVIGFQPKPGWDRVVDRGPDQQIVGVTWSGGSIGPGEFDEFSFEARNPKERGRVTWRAVQAYADGSRIEWTGPQTSDTPAPITTILAPGGLAAGASVGTTAAIAPASSVSSASSDTGLLVALVATVVGLLGLILSIVSLAARRWPRP
jgi:uncharacterized protein YcnI